MGAPLKQKSPIETELKPAARREFGTRLNAWYRENARDLPWRGISDPYRTWVSEIMLQQTRVSAVVEHYLQFLSRFPTLVALALAPEAEVLALWSGLGYYRRARMLHKAAQFVMREHGGTLPSNAADLRRLPGIGIYTSAAIASIAFGERIAVVDGNVERVLLRIAGRPDEATQGTADFVASLAALLMPSAPISPGDHNQAVMELGATVCLPRNPLCLQCPVVALCRTRGEHIAPARAPMRSERAFYALVTRQVERKSGKRNGGGTEIEVLLHRRPDHLSLMPGMTELPPICNSPAAAKEGTPEPEPLLRVRHAIVGTNYYVEVFALRDRDAAKKLAIDAEAELLWVSTLDLRREPLTGLARKALQRIGLLPAELADRSSTLPLIIGRHQRIGIEE